MTDAVPRVHHHPSEEALGVQSEHGLDAHVHLYGTKNKELRRGLGMALDAHVVHLVKPIRLEHVLAKLLSILRRGEREAEKKLKKYESQS